MSIKYAGAAASVMVFAALAAGCSAKTATQPASSSAASSASASTSAATTAAAAPAVAGLAIPVMIMGGVVTPNNGEYEAKVGEPITLNVDSDVADELHVHSVPEHEFEVKPGTGQNFTFTVTVPGQVVIELHSSDKTVATLTVR
ncbi:MAG: hypothetical protein ACOYB7_02120 [Mycobacterium sp.]